MPSVKLRVFSRSCDPGINKEWRREIFLMEKVHALKAEQLAPLVYLALEAGVGKPR